MTTLLTILACFTGAFAFAFGTAGLIGLLSFEQAKRGTFLCILDYVVTGGAVTGFRDIAHNWSKRVPERRLLCVGLACGVACVTLVLLIGRMP
jgi:hypothetical protein